MIENKFYVSRTCTEYSNGVKRKKTLEDCRDAHVYVLLGDPGTGKTTEFKREAAECHGEYITARNFVTFKASSDPNKKGPLFIDALDEMRTNGENSQTRFDEMRKKLKEINISFRISCREADWFGNSDRQTIKDIFPDFDPTILHLDPLTKKDVKEILKNKNISETDKFFKASQQHHLENLLYNPLILDMLIEVVGEKNKWPSSRNELYEKACHKLIFERNTEHQLEKNLKSLATEDILNAAGYLCAIQLLSGITGFELYESPKDKQYFLFSELSNPEKWPLQEALKTKLFQGDTEEYRIPIHRSVAEYLGAQYLAGLVVKRKNPLPLERVLALMPNEIGAITSNLRGLCAWLAVHCTGENRKKLIQRDPLGVLIYGDARNFSIEEKKLIFDTFQNKIKSHNQWPNFDDIAYGALGTKDMQLVLKEKLIALLPNDGLNDKLLAIVLAAITHGDKMPILKEAIENIIRDFCYTSAIRGFAVQAFVHCGAKKNELLKLLDDIDNKIIEDRENEVLANLLDNLYPKDISPERLINYFPQQDANLLSASCLNFWHNKCLDFNKNIPIFLDLLFKKEIKKKISTYFIGGWVETLVLKGLELKGKRIEIPRLYHWLNLCLDEYDHYTHDVGKWISEYPEKYKAIIEYGVSLYDNDSNFEMKMWKHCMGLEKVSPPKDIEAWYLEKAKQESNSRPQVARYYFNKAVDNVRVLTNDRTEFFKNSVQGYSILSELLENRINPPSEPWKQESRRQSQALKKKEQEEIHKRVAELHKHLDSICQGAAFPRIMYELARVYNGISSNIPGATPEERLAYFLNNDYELINAAYTGFKQVIYRKDLPKESEILKLIIEEKKYDISQACLLSAAINYSNDPKKFLTLSDDLLRTLLIFRFIEDLKKDEDCTWMLKLISSRPQFVAEVFIRYALTMIKAKREYISSFHEVMHGKYKDILPLCLVSLLEKFPLRVSEKTTKNFLTLLLKSAMVCLNKEMLKTIIARKVEKPSMDGIQKTYWITCGLILTQNKYINKLIEHIKGKETYIEHFSYFMQSQWKNLSSNLSEKSIGVLLEVLMPLCLAERRNFITKDMTDLINKLIDELQDSSRSTFEIERLLGVKNIGHWHLILENVLNQKKIQKSVDSFQYPDIKKVCETLQNKSPANAADLAALTMTFLREIAANIRNGNTDDYRQYWSNNAKQNPETPKHEDHCRDALLSDLKYKFEPYGITGEPESHFADDNRSDIKIIFNNLFIPIEIKRDCHRDLWKAINGQLVKKYTRDPSTYNYGIFVVFWFGGNNMPNDPKGGSKPQSAKELEERLRNKLTEEERQRIYVLVIDCSFIRL